MRELGIEGYGNFLAYLPRRGVGRRECYAHSVGLEQPAHRGAGRRHNEEREAVGLAEEGRIAVHYLGHVRVVALVGEHDLSTSTACPTRSSASSAPRRTSWST